MKSYPLFIALCASCALIGSAIHAQEQVQPKVVKVGEKAAVQNLDAQAEQQPLRAKIDKNDLFNYLDKNYGTTQKKAESQPVQAEELPKPQARPEAAPEVAKVNSEQKVSEQPWEIKEAVPAPGKQASQSIEPQQIKPSAVKLVEKADDGVQAKRFVLKGFVENSPEKNPSEKKDAFVREAKQEVTKSVVEKEVKQVEPKELGALSPATGKNARWLDKQPKSALESAPVAQENPVVQANEKMQEPISEQKRYPVLNKEMLEKRQVVEAPATPVLVAPQAQSVIKLVEKPAFAPVSAELDNQRVRAPEAGDEKAITKSLNSQMLEAPSAPSKVSVVNRPVAQTKAAPIVQKEVAEFEEAPAEESKVVSKKSVEKKSADSSSAEKVVRSTFTSRVNGLEPADSLDVAKPNSRKLYYFSEVAGMTGRKVTHRWEQNGRVLVEKSMTVGSNKWRLWSSATPKSGSKGDLSVSVLDEQGNVLKTESLGISN